MPDVQSAVGRQPALNSTRDQAVVQDLLNRIAADDGGPLTPLQEPIRANFVSSSLQAAIVRFQQQNVEPSKRDGRVDRVGQTIRKLNELATGTAPPTPTAPTAAKKQVSFHSKPVAPQGKSPPLPPELQPHIVVEVDVDDASKAGDAYRARIREQLRGNPNAAAVENFLNSSPKSSVTGLPTHTTSVVFGDAEVNREKRRIHSGTQVNAGARVATPLGVDTRPVLLFPGARGASVLGPATLLVILDAPDTEPKSASGTRISPNNGDFKRRIGEIAGPRKAPNNDIILQ